MPMGTQGNSLVNFTRKVDDQYHPKAHKQAHKYQT